VFECVSGGGCKYGKYIWKKRVVTCERSLQRKYIAVCVSVCVCVREREREREDGESKLFGSWVPNLYNVQVLDSLFADFLRCLAVFSRPSMKNCT
jgi:hypothetical protein